MKRAAMLDRLRSGEVFDLLVIGGGATGLGTAFDAAARNLTAALVERADFASGTSSRSTKLVHGGVRYLRQGDLGLVRSALRERGRLLRNAPHLVHDLAFVIPTHGAGERLFYGAGLKFYDALAGDLSLGRSRLLDRAAMLARLPTVATAGLRGGVLYHDAQFDDARLALALATGAAERGAALLNHAEVVGFVREGAGAAGRIVGAEVRDRLHGAEFTVRARVVINATGVFVDQLRRREDAAATPLVAVSQGIHLVLPRRFLPGDAALMVPKTADGRVLFAVPWHSVVIVGTTDTPRPAPEAEPRALPEELAFVLEHARRHLSLAPTPQDVLSVFVGQRPLLRAAGGDGASTARLSREHALLVGPGGLLTVTGGKWTTYREMAEQVVDLALRLAGRKPIPCPTANLRLPGADEDLAARPPGGAPAHFAIYGDRAAAVFAAGPATPLHPDLPYTEAEIRHAARHEQARTVEDALARRTRALLLDARAAAACAPRVAAILAEEHGHDGAWMEAEVAAFRALAAGYRWSA